MKQNKNIFINWSTFKRVFALNPALIFNNDAILETLKTKVDSKFFDSSFEDERDEEIDNSNTYELMHELELDSFDLANDSYIEILASNFHKYKQEAENFLLNELKISKENLKIISLSTKKEVKIRQTLELIQHALDLNLELLILNPVLGFDKFQNDHTFTFLYNPFALYIKDQKISIFLLSYTSTSKYETYYLSYYLYNIAKKLNLEINSIKNIIIDPRDKIFNTPKKNKLSFLITEAAWVSNTITKSKSLPYLDYLNNLEFFMKKSGLGLEFFNATFENATSQNYPINFVKYPFNNSFLACAKNNKIEQEIWVINKASYKIELLSSLNSFYDSIKDDLPINKYQGHFRFQNMFAAFEYPNIEAYKLVIPNLKPITKKQAIKEFFRFQDFNWYLKLIIKAFLEFNSEINVNAILFFAKYYDSNEQDNVKSLNIVNNWLNQSKVNYLINYDWIEINDFFIKEAKEITNLLREYLLKSENFEYIQYSGKFKKTKDIRSIQLLKDSINDFNSIPSSFNIETLNIIKNIHIKDALISWYDYEGFSDIFPPVDGIASYNQVVCQVSVITTKNGIEQSCENIVKDPKNITCQDFVEIIDAIYKDKCHYYVVYNKGYENTRNNEILKLVRNKIFNELDLEFGKWLMQRYNNTLESAYKLFAHKIEHINSNTIDLADVFTPKKLDDDQSQNTFYFSQEANEIKIINNVTKPQTSLPIAYIQLSYLKSFYSIKKIEKFITENNIKVKNIITPYSTLKIQKGTMAMKEAINRFLEATNDSVWENNIVPELKKYCENDVRAMIMVYDLIMYLAKIFFGNIDAYEYKLDNSNGFVTLGKYQLKNNELSFDLIN